MKKNKLISCIFAFVLIFTMCIYTFSPAVSAIVSKNGSITLHVIDARTGKAIANESFRLYFFAAAYEKGKGVGYEYVVPYDDCNMDMDNLQDAYLPVHLTHFALTHDLPFKVKSSDSNGCIVFDDLVPGVYLILPMGNLPEYFMPSPFVVNIPVYDKENKNWIYDINPTPKMQIYESEDTEKTTYIKVEKLWETEGSHPDFVTVSLLCDFREVEKVTLDESNSWQYRWDNLSVKHNWSVVENEVPEGYTVSYDTSSNTVTIINKGGNDEPTTSPPETTADDSEEETTTSPGSSSDETTTKPEKLVHTGQLNWPVPVFSTAGLLLFSLGWAILNFGRKDEETV